MNPGSSFKLSDVELEEFKRAVSVVAPPGREQQAVSYVKELVSRRNQLQLMEDRFGNLIVRSSKERSGRPLFFSAHMDHPGLVVVRVEGKEVQAEFRGGTASICRVGSPVTLYNGDRTSIATILRVETQVGGSPLLSLHSHENVSEGDVGTVIAERSFLACDDMAGVCACIQALDHIEERHVPGPVRLVFTRAEEVGMIGAIGACQSGGIPFGSRVLAVDARRGSREADIRVSSRDRSGPINPRLVNECVQAGCTLDEINPTTTEAGVYGAFGFDAAAITYPISCMHNERNGEPVPEQLDVEVYTLLVSKLCSLMHNVGRESTRETLVQHFDRNITVIE